jgi:hypothetical protein
MGKPQQKKGNEQHERRPSAHRIHWHFDEQTQLGRRRGDTKGGGLLIFVTYFSVYHALSPNPAAAADGSSRNRGAIHANGNAKSSHLLNPCPFPPFLERPNSLASKFGI